METDLRKVDQQAIAFWKKNSIPKKTLKFREGEEKFYFFDGPPYASGSIHVGTALNKIMKDYYIRFYRMLGHDVWAQPGYDCHGMPIENKVEKKIGIKNKADIEKFGVENFVKECKLFATEYIHMMNDEFQDLGVWMDWDRPYLTMNNEYIESAWYTFKQGFEKGLLFKGNYSVHVCPHCETAVAYNEIIYKKARDNSIYVKFPIKNKKNEFLIIWTTTPWTLPANTGIMVNPKLIYAMVKVEGETWIVANDLVKQISQKIGKRMTIIEKISGEKLAGLAYAHPLKDELPLQKDIEGKVVTSSKYVSLEEGTTGLVHCAPGHGKEDYEVGKAHKLKVLCPVKMNGTFDSSVGNWAGKYVKDAETDISIIGALHKVGALVHQEQIEHDYPFCWRCETPLIFLAVPQWFFKVTAMRDQLLEQNKAVHWVPSWAGERFENWLESLGDWPISRQRYWGIPLPIWECKKCLEIKVIASADELPRKLKDLHKPYIDEITFKCKKCAGEMRRVPDVLDVWFDAGVATWASLGYPKEQALFKKWWPTDLQIEGPDQIRGWWNAQAITGMMTFDKYPFKHVLFNGFVLDAHGEKMSKSKGGLSPEGFAEKYSRDVLRYYFLSEDHSQDFLFEWDKIAQVDRLLKLYTNVVNFVETYCQKGEKLRDLQTEDKWIVSRANTVISEIEDANKNLNYYKAVKIWENFVVNNLSKNYIKFIRERTRANYEGEGKKAASATMYYVLKRMNAAIAPACVHLAESIYQDLLKEKKDPESIHMSDWPAYNKKMIDKKLESQMNTAFKIIEAASNLRNSINMKLRQPLRELVVITTEGEVTKALEATKNIIASQTNVKNVRWATVPPKGDYAQIVLEKMSVALDKVVDEELLTEGRTREVVRRIQEMRKELGLKEKDSIDVNILEPINVDKEMIKKQTNAKRLEIGKKVLSGKEKVWNIGEMEITIIVKS